jgi:sulfur carrier protein ThiS
MEFVRAGKLPGKIAEIALDEGATVADALEVAELAAEGYEIRVNGTPADAETELAEGDVVLLVKKIKGNG